MLLSCFKLIKYCIHICRKLHKPRMHRSMLYNKENTKWFKIQYINTRPGASSDALSVTNFPDGSHFLDFYTNLFLCFNSKLRSLIVYFSLLLTFQKWNHSVRVYLAYLNMKSLWGLLCCFAHFHCCKHLCDYIIYLSILFDGPLSCFLFLSTNIYIISFVSMYLHFCLLYSQN